MTRSMPTVAPEEMSGFDFDEIIDVRSPSEFVDDHVTGAINLPVLDDSQRSRVGTVYKQVNAFEARRIGAAMVSANIADHLAAHFMDKPQDYSPLIYCWRGGQRSRSLATILTAVGWKAHLIKGGYKEYRKFVSASLNSILEKSTDFRVIAGLTGTGKTRLLQRLEAMGCQVIDLEGLASHRGSVLGDDPERGQSTQKRFENLLLGKIKSLDPMKPIYLESESSRIGRLQVPEKIWIQMKAAPVIELSVPLKARANYLMQEYPHFTDNPDLLLEKIDAIKKLQSRETVQQWEDSINEGNFMAFVESILSKHYDPAYLRSRKKTYSSPCAKLSMDKVSEEQLDQAAGEILDLEAGFTASATNTD